MFTKGNIPWNKNLTKETDERVMKHSIFLSILKMGKRETLFCLYCGNEFQAKIFSTQKFCSKKCYWESLKGKPNNAKGKHWSLESRINFSLNNPTKSPEVREKIRISKIKSYKEHPEIIEIIKEKRLKQVFPVKDTSIEVKMQKALSEENILHVTHFPFHKEGIATQIDIAIPEKKIAIYCDGDYWHNLPNYVIRDNRANEVLLKNGWKVFRFWEHEINDNLKNCSDKIKKFIESLGGKLEITNYM